MHVHANQMIQYGQLDAAYAAETATAKQASNIRRKLRTFASLLECGTDVSEDCVEGLGPQEDSNEHGSQQDPQEPPSRSDQAEYSGSNDEDGPASYWA